MRTTGQPAREKPVSSRDLLVRSRGACSTSPELVYDLRLDGEDSHDYYSEVAAFSRRVLAETDRRAAVALDGYSHDVAAYLHETPRSRGEYALEFLGMGRSIRLYGNVAAATPDWVVFLARGLFQLRRLAHPLKPAVDFLRAGLFQIYMHRNMHRGGNAPAGEEFDLNQLARLIQWMQGTGEFEQEWRRLENWRGYCSRLSPGESRQWIAVSIRLFDWFAGEAEAVLGKYTAGVTPFLQTGWAKRFWREDQIFCGRQPVEYHLGMVAAEVMNQGLRADFHQRPRKVVLVPGCMHGARAATCKAVTHDLDIRCAGCDPHCAVHQVTRRMRSEGIAVYIVPHSSGFSRWLERWQNDPAVGVTAVACMMNILAGGYEMRARGIASQCVPLDFPACRKHWREDEVATTVNQERLVQIVRGPQP
jgi:uncharacterized protein